MLTNCESSDKYIEMTSAPMVKSIALQHVGSTVVVGVSVVVVASSVVVGAAVVGSSST